MSKFRTPQNTLLLQRVASGKTSTDSAHKSENLRHRAGMPTRFTHHFIFAIVGAGLLCTGFLSGWLASRSLIIVSDANRRPASLTSKGDASNSVRIEVMAALDAFQHGYTRRDIHQVGKFMQQLFPNAKSVLLVGTNSGEWIEGYDSIARFIAGDWARWGDVHLAVDDALISSDGSVAWLATTGKVKFGRSERPIKFLAVLSRANNRWLFHQVQFQWDDRNVGLADLPHLGILSGLRLR